MLEETGYVYKVDEKENENTKEELVSICIDLVERGYDPIKQIAEYIISGDPGYISSYKECRSRIQRYDRTTLIELMLHSYLK